MKTHRSMRIRNSLAALGVLALVTSAAACAADGKPGEATASGDQAELEIFSWWTSGSESDALKTLTDLYSASFPDVKVTNGAVSGGGGSNATQVLQARIAGDDLPSSWQSGPGYAQLTYVDAGITGDLTAIYEEEGWKSVTPPDMLEALSKDGRVYGILAGVHRENVIWTNTALFDQAGVTLPRNPSWEEFKAAVEKLDAAGIVPVCLGDQQIMTGVTLIERTLLMNLGVDDMRRLQAGELEWSDPRVAQALNDYLFIFDHVNSDHAALTWDQGVAKMADGECAMNTFGDPAYGELTRRGLEDGKDFSYMTFPGTDGVFIATGDSFVINGKAEGAALTAQQNWVKVIGSKEGQLAFNKIKGSIPFRTDVDTTQFGQYQQMSAADYKSSQVIPTMAFGQSVPPNIQQAMYDATTQFNNDRNTEAFVKAMTTAYASR